MKHLPTIAGTLLGLMFFAFGLMYFFITPPNLPEGSPAALFMGAVGPTGYMSFVKSLEVLGGILVAVPRTRNFGLLVLGPIIVNILAFNIFITKGADLFNPVLIVIVLITLFLLWSERKAFAGLWK